ncbi:MAG: 4'-phosphopantetheinyl transferase superfamily protein [Coriobacteriia bacterium]|nr:4'-phosphopantetheinyl transferase superfamily protein [Coriobacteriia bacterium]
MVTPKMSEKTTMHEGDIAIVGMSVLSPAGDTVDEFWHGISQGKSFIKEVPDYVIDPYHFTGNPDDDIDVFYCKHGGFMQPVSVDPLRYGVMPIAAGGTDPEQLVSLMAAEQALIDADAFENREQLKKCSVILGRGGFAGLIQMRFINIMRTGREMTRLLKSVLPELTDDDLTKVKRAYQAEQGRYHPDMATGTMPNLMASLINNTFDLQGPSYVVDAACASGIIVINQSISLLRSGQCEIALAGAMHLGHSPMFWGTFDLIRAQSQRQVIAPFSEDADGLLIGQGIGFVVLKTLRQAILDGNKIYAIIKETSVCSDGAASHVITTSTEGQVRAIDEAWSKTGMDPNKLGFIEAHGTATVVGDKTEIESIKTYFGDNSKPRAYVGSLKSNIGHAMPACAILSVIKTALALHHKKIPPTLNCPNPIPSMFESRFRPPTELIDWDGEELPHVAGVNAFGFGGVNAHAIMTTYEPPSGSPVMKRKPYLGDAITVTANTGQALIEKLARGDYSAPGGDYRMVVFEPDDERIKQAIAIIKEDKPWHGGFDIWFTNKPLLQSGGKISFMFPGYWEGWDAETDSLSEALDLPYMSSLVAATEKESARHNSQKLYQSKALGKAALEKLGVEADFYTGYSIGEYDAAVFAGILNCDVNSWADAFSSVLEGFESFFDMVVVNGVNRKQAEQWCKHVPELYLSSIDSPHQIMLSGTDDAVNSLVEILQREEIVHVVLPKRVGVHTPLAEGLFTNLEPFFKGIEICEGSTPVWSATLQNTLPTQREQYLSYLTEELTKPVCFTNLVEKLYDEQQARVFIQVGSGPLVSYVEDILSGKEFASMATSVSSRNGAQQMRRIMALLFVEGHKSNCDFLGVKPQYQSKNTLLRLAKGAPALLEELPELSELVAKRYGKLMPGGLMGSQRASLQTENPIVSNLDANIADAIAVQREIVELFESSDISMLPRTSAQRTSQSKEEQRQSLPQAAQDSVLTQQSSKDDGAQSAQSRKGSVFEEPLHLTFEDHPYLVDHSVVRQPKGWHVAEDLSPVVPFAMTLEIAAEIAMKYAPGQKLVTISNASAYRWIALEQPFDTIVKGKWLSNNTVLVSIGDYFEAECTFANEYPEPLAEFDGDLDIGDEIVKRRPAAEWYDRFSFHGPQYRSITKQDKICQRGMTGALRSAPGRGSLLDAMGQQLGLFLHITQTENTISFPVRMKEIVLYDDLFDQEGEFESKAVVTRLTKNIIAMDVVYLRNGKQWCLGRGFTLQRFQNVPEVWQIIVNPQHNKLSKEIAPGVFFYQSDMHDNLVLFLSRRYLNSFEREELEKLENSGQKREHLISRIALKDAVRMSARVDDEELLWPIEFYCKKEESGKPYLRGHGRAAEKVDGLKVSLSHKTTAAIAIVSDKPVGIDLEEIDATASNNIDEFCTSQEQALLADTALSHAALRFWVAKEAYTKMTGEGLKGTPKRYEVASIDGEVLTIGNSQIKTVVLEDKYVAGWTV